MWNVVPHKEKDAINANYKKKKHVNTINVQNCSITVIVHNEKYMKTIIY